MMGLYEVTVVNTKTNKVVITDRVFAKNVNRAKLKVAAALDQDIPDEVEFFVYTVGEWESHKPKEVKIVKEK